MYIETPRLILREFTLDDAQAVFDFSSNLEVSKYTGDTGLVTKIDDAIKIINQTWLPEYKKYGYARLALVEKSSKEVIGFSGLKFLEDFQLPDLGYRMLPEYWGRGYATESGKAVLDYAKTHLNMETVMAMTMKENLASQKVLQKLGFSMEREEVVDGFEAFIFMKHL